MRYYPSMGPTADSALAGVVGKEPSAMERSRTLSGDVVVVVLGGGIGMMTARTTY